MGKFKLYIKTIKAFLLFVVYTMLEDIEYICEAVEKWSYKSKWKVKAKIAQLCEGAED